MNKHLDVTNDMANGEAPKPVRHPTLLALIVGGAFFMEVLDGSIIAPAVPEIARSFDTSAVAVSAGISSYLITVAIFIPASAWLSERLGARNVFACAIALFTLSSIMCGLSGTLTQFTLARIVQGVGGAMMSPVGRIAVLRRTEKSEMLRIVAYLSWPGLTAFIVGPPVGGFLTTMLSWRWIFFINIPIGLVGIALVLIFFDREPANAKRRFDALGFVLTGGALACLMYGIEGISRHAGIVISAGFMLAGALLGAAALRHANRHPTPILPLTLFKIASFRTAILLGGLPFRLVSGANGFLVPVMFQVAFGKSALDAGVLFGYFLAGDLVIKVVANRLIRWFGFRPMLIATSLSIAASLVAFMMIDRNTPLPLLIPLLVASGAVRSIQFTALNTIVYADMPQEQIGNASTLNSMLQQLGFGLGVGLAAIVLAVSSQWHGGGSGALTLFDFRAGYAFCLVLILLSVGVYVRMPAQTGAHMR